MQNAPQPDGETGNGGTVRAFKLTGQNLTGNVKPCRAIGSQIESPCFQQIQKLTLVLAQRVGEVGRHAVAGNDGQLVAAWFAKLPPANYDRCREDEAKRLKIRVGTLDAEMEKRRSKSVEKLQGSTMNLANLEPWPEAVDGAALLDEIRAIYNRFMILPTQADVLVTGWNLHTYVFDCFSYTPYLHVTSPEKECGKSTLGELMNHLCANATTPGGMSAAAMFRRIESRKPTLLLDEWDTLSDENR